MLHESAVNHGSPRRHWAKLTCNMPILAWRWDINKLLKRRKIRIHFLQRKCVNFFLSLSLTNSVWQVSVMSFSSRHHDLQMCYQGWRWKVISNKVLSEVQTLYHKSLPNIRSNVDPAAGQEKRTVLFPQNNTFFIYIMIRKRTERQSTLKNKLKKTI